MYKKLKLLFSILSFIGLVLLLTISILFAVGENIKNFNTIIYSLLLVVILILIIYIGLFYFFSYRKNLVIKNNLNNFDSKIISNFGLGLVILSPDEEIIWVSQFILERFGTSVLNKKIWDLIPNFKDDNERSPINRTVLYKNGLSYALEYDYSKKIITLKESTNEQIITSKYFDEKIVIGEMDIDNFQKYQSSFSEEEIFRIISEVNAMLERLVQKYHIMFKQYSNGKYILFVNMSSIKKMTKNKFSEFFEIANWKEIKDINLSCSVGFGYGSNNFDQLSDTAREALRKAQARGGNQVVLQEIDKKPEFYGSKSEIAVDKNSSLLKMVASNFDKKLKDPNIKNVIIYGHIMADLDAIGAAYAVYNIAKKSKKNAYIQNQIFDKTSKKSLSNFFKPWEIKSIFITKRKANMMAGKNTLVVVVDCSTKERVENPRLFYNIKDNNIFIFDHHRVSKINENINIFNVYIESTASSSCEIITELFEFNNYLKYLEARAAQMLLDGIFLDTSKLQKSTSSRTFAAAAKLEDLGANSVASNEILKMTPDELNIISDILKTLQEIKPGYWLAAFDQETPTDIISMASDEILRVSGRKAAFVIAKLPKESSFAKNNIYKMSARGLEVNVQIIAESVGGGGHFSSAAAVSDYEANESFNSFKDNIIQAIISTNE